MTPLFKLVYRTFRTRNQTDLLVSRCPCRLTITTVAVADTLEIAIPIATTTRISRERRGEEEMREGGRETEKEREREVVTGRFLGAKNLLLRQPRAAASLARAVAGGAKNEAHRGQVREIARRAWPGEEGER